MEIVKTTFRLRGLTKKTVLMHLTDLHLSEADERDGDRAIALSKERKFCFHRRDGVLLPDLYQAYLRRADADNIDCITMTGDMIDFPSHPNLELLESTLNQAKRRYLYTFGNHDWHYLYDPQTAERKKENTPLFDRFTNASPDFQVCEINGARLIAVDNSLYQISQKQLERFHHELSLGQPCLVFFHIPLFTSTLLRHVVDYWKNPIMMGTPKELLDLSVEECRNILPSETTLEFCRLLREDPNVAGIITGHVHFFHKDEYAPGKIQFITGCGECSEITLLPC